MTNEADLLFDVDLDLERYSYEMGSKYVWRRQGGTCPIRQDLDAWHSTLQLVSTRSSFLEDKIQG